MAQAQRGGQEEQERNKIEEHVVKSPVKCDNKIRLKEATNINSSSSSNKLQDASFKFNAQAPEFVPRSRTTTSSSSNNQGQGQGQSQALTTQSQSQVPISGYFYPCIHYLGATGGSDWFIVGDQDPATYLISNPNLALPNGANKNTQVLTDDLRLKIIKQVEYQFSDMSLLANESMSKHISKDPEGYVPISVIASTKKMKSLINNNHLLAQALQSSSKLLVTEDGKKVKRKIPFTEKDKEDLQARTVVVENLPEDHSHQNVEKIFGVVGSVKTIRICHPQESNSSRPKSTDFFTSNKLHALVEFETPEIAEKAVEKLNDERNWRKGLRVRLLLRCSPKSVLKMRKPEFDSYMEDDDNQIPESSAETSPVYNPESANDSNFNKFVVQHDESSGLSKKVSSGGGRGRGKGRGRGGSSGRGLLTPTGAQSEAAAATASSTTTPKHGSKGPRMPDGTRGFGLGRGKTLVASAVASSLME